LYDIPLSCHYFFYRVKEPKQEAKEEPILILSVESLADTHSTFKKEEMLTEVEEPRKEDVISIVFN
jgi:hypothetical protein